MNKKRKVKYVYTSLDIYARKDTSKTSFQSKPDNSLEWNCVPETLRIGKTQKMIMTKKKQGILTVCKMIEHYNTEERKI